ncbi:MAG TPA: ABC transporter, partial [Firmicutes bacterium]|nr:ABC transporter [Bacillota bacterium]
ILIGTPVGATIILVDIVCFIAFFIIGKFAYRRKV